MKLNASQVTVYAGLVRAFHDHTCRDPSNEEATQLAGLARLLMPTETDEPEVATMLALMETQIERLARLYHLVTSLFEFEMRRSPSDGEGRVMFEALVRAIAGRPVAAEAAA